MRLIRHCPNCGHPICGRPNKKFCSANCRKRSSEPLQNSYESSEKKKRNLVLFDSASRLAEIYFQKPPIERLALMRDYVTMAREGNTKMREILSNSYLMDKKNDCGNPYKGKRGRSYGSRCRYSCGGIEQSTIAMRLTLWMGRNVWSSIDQLQTVLIPISSNKKMKSMR